MADRLDDLEERVQVLETRMDQVPATIDQRFDAVDAAIAEQRQYTEFAFDKLERSMIARFDGVDAEFAGIKGEFTGIKGEFAGLKTEVRAISSGLGRLERKLDQFIDRHLPPTPSDTPEQPK
jgi:archaellum component FlaC